MSGRGRHAPILSTGRLEAVTDGIFTVGMTLLVVGLQVPERGLSAEALHRALRGLLPQFLVFLLCFYLLGKLWVEQLHVSAHLRRVDRIGLMLHLLWLLQVVLLPFTSDLMGTYPEVFVSQALFHLNLFGLGFLPWFLWCRCARRGFLDESLSSDEEVRIRRRGLALPGTALGALGLAWFAPDQSSLVYLLLPVLRRVLDRWGDQGVRGPASS